MITPEDLEACLRELSGTGDVLPLIRDPSTPTGLRPWTDDDSRTLRQWLLTQVDEREGSRDLLICYSQKRAAVLVLQRRFIKLGAS